MTCTMSTFALPAELALLVSDLEHVLALNGHRAQQHAKYISEELQAKAQSRDEQDEGKLHLCSTTHVRRAKELLLKHEAFEMCFDAFEQSLNMHLPSHQTNFLQKLWRHAMLLVEGWQDLHEHEQQEIKSMTLEYIHLQQEHRALKSNLKTLKLTVQAMLGDVGALLHAACPLGKEAAALAGTASSSQSSGNDNSRSSSRNSGSASDSGQPHQSERPARRSTDIVNSLIHSIERMSKQFAECQVAGKLAAGAAAAADISGQPQPDQQHQAHRLASSQQGAGTGIPAAAAAGSRRHAQSSHRTAAAAGAAEQAGVRLKAGMPPVAPEARSRSCKQGNDQGRGKACRNMITARSADPSSPAMRQNIPLALAGASPNRSHPPSAYDNSLAWFKQNAQGVGGDCSGRSSRPPSGQQAERTAAGGRSPAAQTSPAPADSQLGVLSPGDSVCHSAADSCPPAQGSITSEAVTPPARPAVGEAADKAATTARNSGSAAAAGREDARAPAAADRGRQQAPTIEVLRQRQVALHAAHAAVRCNPDPAELDDEPSVGNWGCSSAAGGAGSAGVAAAARDVLSPGEACSSSGSGNGRKWGSSSSGPAHPQAGQQQHAGQPSSEAAQMAAGTAAGDVLDESIYMPEAAADSSSTALATQQQQQPGSKRRYIRHQQLLPRSNSASLLNAAAHLADRPISSYAGGRSHSSNSSRGNNSGLAAAALSRSRTFSSASPASTAAAAAAGYVPAGPLTAALHKQNVVSRPALNRHMIAAGHCAPLASAAGQAASRGLPPAAATAAVPGTRILGSAGASLAQAGGASNRAAVAAAVYDMSSSADVEGEAAAARASSDSGRSRGSIRAAWEQQRQQAYSQRLVQKQQQQQQQQQMAPVPEGVMADEPVLTAADRKAAASTYSVASSSIGSDLVQLGSCNAGFWQQGATSTAATAAKNDSSVNISSPPEVSTASWQDNPTYVKGAGVAGTVAAAKKAAAEMTGVPATPVAPKVAERGQAAAAPVLVSAVAGTDPASNIQAAPQADLAREQSEAAYTGLLNAAAAAAIAVDSTGDPADAATAGTHANEDAAVSPGDLPDALKPVQLSDSPTKQLRKAATIAAAAAASGAAAVAARSSTVQQSIRASGDKRSLHSSNSGSIAGASQQQQQQGGQAAAEDSSTTAAIAAAGDTDCMSPNAPLSKRLRASVALATVSSAAEHHSGSGSQSSADAVEQDNCTLLGCSNAASAVGDPVDAQRAANGAAVAQSAVQEVPKHCGRSTNSSAQQQQLFAEVSQDDVGPLRDRDRIQRDTGAAADTERTSLGSRSSVHRSGKTSSTAKQGFAPTAAATAGMNGGNAEALLLAATAAAKEADVCTEIEAAEEASVDDAPSAAAEHQPNSSSPAYSDEALPAAAPAAGSDATERHSEACEEGAGLNFSLDELVAIIMDVMHSKQEEDGRCAAAGVPRLTPTVHLQRYLSSKVHGDSSAYSHALNALLGGLDGHKQQQPDVAVFCRILAGEVDEDYFQQHCAFASQLHCLATAAVQEQQEDEQEGVTTWDACSTAVLQQQQLRGLLEDWGKARLVLQGKLQQDAAPSDEQQEQLLHLQVAWLDAISKHCSSDAANLHAGGVVAALLLWELHRQVGRLETTVEAFRAADQERRGTLHSDHFRVFCQQLNDAMSDEEVTLLWQELDKHDTGSVTFSTICACLLPVMSDDA